MAIFGLNLYYLNAQNVIIELIMILY